MPIVARDNQKEFTPAPEGLHQSVCVDVVDLGLVDGQWGLKPKVQLRWQLEETFYDEINNKTRRHMAVNSYTLSLNSKAKLRQHLEAWRGRKFTADELKGFDLEKLLGANCQLQIVHNISDNNRVWANVQAIVPLGKGMDKITEIDYTRVKDRETTRTEPDPEEPPIEDDDLPF